MNIDLVVIGGYLTRDPEKRYTTTGKAVTSFTVAVNRHWTSESGEKKQEATFIDCESWGKPAETIAEHFAKGHRILLNGRHKLEQWEDRSTGAKRSRMKIIVESFQFIERKEDQDGAPARPAREPRPANPATEPKTSTEEDDDVPF